MHKLTVKLEKKSSRTYDLHIGRGILDRIGLILKKNGWGDRHIIITDANVRRLHGDRVLGAFRHAGLATELLSINPGEKSKDISVCAELTESLLALGADRGSCIVALGGGVVGDIAGFVASIFMRGVSFVQVPTTLMAQVDSSIGGKTGIDLPAAKNLLGTFHQPRAVFIDLDFLGTLPGREFQCGLAEVVKYGIIEDPALLETLRRQGNSLAADSDMLQEIVARACRIKKMIVEMDEKDLGIRRILNFGHTIGHGIEAASAYSLSHGEALAVGMAGALRISERQGYLPRQETEAVESLMESLGFSIRLPAGVQPDDVIERMRKDKKSRNGRSHFVLIKRPGLPFVNGDVPEQAVREVLEGLLP